MKLFFRRTFGLLAQLWYPYFGTCYHCWRPWPTCREHITRFLHGGCFPLCEDCWLSLLPNERLVYYVELWERWLVNDAQYQLKHPDMRYVNAIPLTTESWQALQRAVMEGK